MTNHRYAEPAGAVPWTPGPHPWFGCPRCDGRGFTWNEPSQDIVGCPNCKETGRLSLPPKTPKPASDGGEEQR